MEELNYNRKISKLRQERKEARDKIVQMTTEIDGILNSLALDKGETEVSWAKMKTIALGIRFYVNKDVYFIKTKDEDERMVFKVYLNAGGKFGLQTHDCIEELYVIKGDLIDANNSDRVYAVGETKIWEPNKLHKPICTVESIWRATKIKTDDNDRESI